MWLQDKSTPLYQNRFCLSVKNSAVLWLNFARFSVNGAQRQCGKLICYPCYSFVPKTTIIYQQVRLGVGVGACKNFTGINSLLRLQVQRGKSGNKSVTCLCPKHCKHNNDFGRFQHKTRVSREFFRKSCQNFIKSQHGRLVYCLHHVLIFCLTLITCLKNIC